MIARAWHGITTAEKADDYMNYLNETGIAEYKKTEGNCGVYVLRSIQSGQAHFLLISLWDSYDAIRKFAGDNIEQSHYYDEDKYFLLELEPTVTHYEVLSAL